MAVAIAGVYGVVDDGNVVICVVDGCVIWVGVGVR